MWKFYKAVFRTAIKEFWTAADEVLTGVAVLSFLAILFSRKYGEHLVTAWNGISPGWSVVPIGLLVMYRLLKANYEQFEALRRDHAGELKATEDKWRKTVSALEETTRGTLAAAEEQHRKALQSADDNCRSLRTELSAAQQQLAALQRDWVGSWQELAAQFRELVKHRIFAQWRRLSDGESWDITGGGQEAIRRIESLCKHAGDLLLASPKVAQSVAPELLNRPTARDRWLFYLKATSGAFRQDTGYGVETLPTGEKINLLFGTIPDLPDIAANACMECASQEY